MTSCIFNELIKCRYSEPGQHCAEVLPAAGEPIVLICPDVPECARSGFISKIEKLLENGIYAN